MTTPTMSQLLAEGRFEEAEAEARRRLAQNARDEYARLVCARAALWRGQADEAEQHVSQVTSPGARTDVALVRAQAAMVRGNWTSARDQAIAVVRQLTPPPDAWFILGLARMKLGDVKGACHAQDKAVKLAPRRADIRFELGRALAANRQPRAAAHQFVQALRLTPEDTRLHASLALVLEGRGKRRLALGVLDAGLQYTPDDPYLLELRQTIEALRGPRHPAGSLRAAAESLRQQTAALLAQKRHRDAHKLLLDAWNKGVRSATLKLLEAEACQGLAPPDMPGAIAACEEALALEPDNWLVHNSLGRLLLEEGQRHMERAIERFQEARRLAPQRPEPMLNLALAYSQIERGPEARELARAAQAQLPPGDPLQGPVQELLAALKGV